MSPSRLAKVLSACAVISALTTPVAVAHGGGHHHDHGGHDHGRTIPGYRADEAAVIGEEHAEEHARLRMALQAQGEYPQPTRDARFKMLTDTQRTNNAKFDPSVFGRFTGYFPSKDFGDHVALLPTGKVLLFSFERVETDPTKEPAPTNVIGAQNAGRAYLWDPAKGQGADAFTAVPPPKVTPPDGTGISRPAPFFCSGHSFLPNGMLGVYGGNIGGNGGTGAKLSLIFNPWNEKWSQNEDMAVGRWYPSVVTGADGRQLIMSGQSEMGWGTPTPLVERFPAKNVPVPLDKSPLPSFQKVQPFKADAPFTLDYPHLFSMNDGKIYGFGRQPAEQWSFDINDETRADLPARLDSKDRNYGAAVPLPNGVNGPDSVMVLGGNRDDPNTYEFSGGAWKTSPEKRAFGRTQDDTIILPNGRLLTVNGAHDIRDYGNGALNPNSHQKYRQIELRDDNGKWKLGPMQRLPRGYHSNAVVLPDGRVMVTGDELQQLANDDNINDDNNGTIEIYEPPYLNRGPRPDLGTTYSGPTQYGNWFSAESTDMNRVTKAVLLSPTTSTHSVNTSQRYVELRILGRHTSYHWPDGTTSKNMLQLQAPYSANTAPPGWYMLFLLDEDGTPSTAKWVQLVPRKG